MQTKPGCLKILIIEAVVLLSLLTYAIGGSLHYNILDRSIDKSDRITSSVLWPMNVALQAAQWAASEMNKDYQRKASNDD